MKRKLLTGDKVKELDKAVKVGDIISKCPDKWLFVDMEKGNYYIWNHVTKRWNFPPKGVEKWIEKALKELYK